jgi:hypothetical protein
MLRGLRAAEGKDGEPASKRKRVKKVEEIDQSVLDDDDTSFKTVSGLSGPRRRYAPRFGPVVFCDLRLPPL